MSKGLSDLLADATEPPEASPTVVVAVDVHNALTAIAAEGGVTPVTVGVFPVSDVGVLVGKGRVGFVDRAYRIRIIRQTALLKHLGYFVVAGFLPDREEFDGDVFLY